MSLEELRKRIDAIDRELVELLCRRAETAVEIGAEKRRHQATIHDPSREDEVLAQAVRSNRGPLSSEAVRAIFRDIMDACSRVQERPGRRARRGVVGRVDGIGGGSRRPQRLEKVRMATWNELARPGLAKLAPYEPGRPIETVAREFGFANPDDIIKLASNENALGPSPRAITAMRDAAARMHLYPDGGSFALRAALAARLKVGADCILPGCGSNELIELLGHAFLSPDSSIVMADCAFLVYRLVAASFGAKTVDVPMREYTHDLPAMRRAVRPDTRIVFIANPNNPTSTMVAPEEIDAFMQQVPPDVVVCFDEAYVELLAPERQADTLRYVREGRKVIVLRTFSKTYGLAGLRIGYGVAPVECIELLNRLRQPFNVSAMAQAAAIAALEDEAHVERTRRMVADGIKFLQDEFRRLSLSFVPATVNFVLVEVGDGRAIFQALMRLGVIVRPMDPYGLPRHIRVTVGTQQENERFVESLRSVLAQPARAGKVPGRGA